MDPGEVSVWIVAVDEESAARRAVNYLPETEQARLKARAQPHRRRSLSAHAALRILAAAAIGRNPPLPDLVMEPGGRPALRSGRTRALEVSLSRAGAFAAIALCPTAPVGVDIEGTEPLPDRERFAGSILTDVELAEWQRVPGPDRDATLAQVFTRKEAVLKALGLGLAGDLRRVGTRIRPGPVGLHLLPPSAGDRDTWTVLDLDVPEGLRGAVAVRASGARLTENRTTITELLRTSPPDPPRPVLSSPVLS
jgi:4'-phosphopantetheinyl transferase